MLWWWCSCYLTVADKQLPLLQASYYNHDWFCCCGGGCIIHHGILPTSPQIISVSSYLELGGKGNHIHCGSLRKFTIKTTGGHSGGSSGKEDQVAE